MGSSVGVKLSQKQALALTPELVQSIKLLSKSGPELDEFVKDRLEENPFLEKPSDVPAGPAQPSAKVPGPDPAGARSMGAQSSGGSASVSTQDLLGQLPDTSVSLVEHIASQIRLHFEDRLDRSIAFQIVISLDEDGYLRRPLESLAAELGIAEERVATVLSAVQSFDPAGIAARSLGECFQRQLEDKGRFPLTMKALLANLDLLAKGETKKLMRLCDVDRETLVGMVNVLRTLDPKPARRFDCEPVPQAVPDVYLTKSGEGGWKVALNPQALPRVLVNRDYYSEVARGLDGEEERKFVVDCMTSANWLVRSLDQRAQTILKVATEIVRKQGQFFSHGASKLVPLSRTDVAETLKIHESTVSRAVANKYLQCDLGVFDLGYFFSAKLSGTDGETVLSAEAVRHKLVQLIEGETRDKVLSDDDLASNLHADGIHIARRTVAKYREELKIPSSSKRRRRLKANALLA
ncbi:RNA polymerase factor sigma-54 [Pacificoceanicola onchidii]|uniref:RNA polymerase factor sigma-54 n=1 Tax=Pacificoceanicola onchidii TaxID=2562685 RepID=UPI0010A2D052|nr:RNA polymerase factor sigma-54 [Pacificoceanicola onchidii]